ncbi:DUF882 domain-containing protein [Bosea sp. (in: a-proteobacteria)]|jgi:uncharacterized protein YcbK (DUF882 family)|uniref:DUF882 domain-containing protein n=1 Tax=Bosea sp. (in: a-proteobacteria) TaxID=1871050 RepID=UPI003F6E9194
MRQFVMAAMVAACLPLSARANIPVDKISFQPQVKGLGCLKPETLAMIKELVAKIGPIQITSTCGGRHARRSQHYRGNAIDFRPLATSARKAVAAAKTLENRGGVGSYSNGVVHVDVGEREIAWYGHKRAKRRYAHVARNGR